MDTNHTMHVQTFQEADNRADFDGKVPSSSRDSSSLSPRPLCSAKSAQSPISGLSPGPAPSTLLHSVDSVESVFI